MDSDLQIKNEPKNTTTAVVCDDKSNCHLVKNKDVIVSLIAVDSPAQYYYDQIWIALMSTSRTEKENKPIWLISRV